MDWKFTNENTVITGVCLNKRLLAQLPGSSAEDEWLKVEIPRCVPEDRLLDSQNRIRELQQQVTDACGDIMSLRADKNELIDALRLKEQENAKLRSELERRKLKWQSGMIPADDNYWFRRPGEKPWCGWSWLDWKLNPTIEWAGPIEPPEE